LRDIVTIQTEKSRSAHRILQVLKRWKAPKGEDQSLFRAFAAETIDRIRGPFLAQHPSKEVLKYLEAAFAYAKVRQGEDIKVDIGKSPLRGVRVVANMQDQPFIVDTIRLFLRRAEVDYWGGFHVIFRAIRDEDGTLVGVGEGGSPESLTLLEGDFGRLRGLDLEDAGQRLHHSLLLAKVTVRDFRPLLRAVDRMVERFEDHADRSVEHEQHHRETAAFLRWLQNENFVFMGGDVGDRELGIQTVEGPYRSSHGGAWTPPHAPGTVFVRKSAIESPIHRAGRIDEIRVVFAEGTPREESLFLRGMFTYRAVTQPSRQVPILRGVLKNELLAQDATPGSFRYKGIANVFDSLPTEFLFTTPQQAISEMIDLVLDSEQQQEVGVTILTSGENSAFVLVSMPKSDYSDELRREVEEHVVNGTGATYCDHGLFMSRFDTVLLHFYLTGVSGTASDAVQGLTEKIRAMATPWISRLWQAIAREGGEDRADYLVDTYGRSFPEAWARKTSVERAVQDIEQLDALAGHSVLADVFEDRGGVHLRVYQARSVSLTDLLPVLGNFGITVQSSEAVLVTSRGGALSFDTFLLAVDDEEKTSLLRYKELLTQALPRVFALDVDDDPFN
jgi:glutamate dehydrogenase